MTVPTYAARAPVYQKQWDEMRVLRSAEAETEAKRILANKARYQAVEKATGSPWWFTGLLHYREASFNFSTYLGNGDPLSRRTRDVPAGRGPFASWEDGAIDALKMRGLTKVTDWGVPRAAYEAEGWNGWGYYYRGVTSDYLWGGTSEHPAGLYVADHVYDPNRVGKQLGVMAILKALMALDASVEMYLTGKAPATKVAPTPAPAKPKPAPAKPAPAPAKPEAPKAPAKAKPALHPAAKVAIGVATVAASAHTVGVSNATVIIGMIVVAAVVAAVIFLSKKQ